MRKQAKFSHISDILAFSKTTKYLFKKQIIVICVRFEWIFFIIIIFIYSSLYVGLYLGKWKIIPHKHIFQSALWAICVFPIQCKSILIIFVSPCQSNHYIINSTASLPLITIPYNIWDQ